MPEPDPTKRRLTWTVFATPLMTFTTDLGLSIRVSMFEYVRLVAGTSSKNAVACAYIDWNRRLVCATYLQGPFICQSHWRSLVGKFMVMLPSETADMRKVMLPSETADMRKLSASRARCAHELCMPHHRAILRAKITPECVGSLQKMKGKRLMSQNSCFIHARLMRLMSSACITPSTEK